MDSLVKWIASLLVVALSVKAGGALGSTEVSLLSILMDTPEVVDSFVN